jgi:hypothetical protein
MLPGFDSAILLPHDGPNVKFGLYYASAAYMLIFAAR